MYLLRFYVHSVDLHGRLAIPPVFAPRPLPHVRKQLMRGLLQVLLTVLTISAAAAVAAADETEGAGTAEQLAFFESKIRPVLVAHCY